MYQIYERLLKSGWAHTDMFPMDDAFYLSKDNAQKEVDRLVAMYAPRTYENVITGYTNTVGKDGEFEYVYGNITYPSNELYEVREITPRDAPKDLPF